MNPGFYYDPRSERPPCCLYSIKDGLFSFVFADGSTMTCDGFPVGFEGYKLCADSGAYAILWYFMKDKVEKAIRDKEESNAEF